MNEGILRGVIRSGGSLRATVRCADRIGGNPYDGAYTVRPSLTAQTLATKDRTMTDNLTVEQIPMESVSNQAGGITVIIG